MGVDLDRAKTLTLWTREVSLRITSFIIKNF